MLSSLTNIRPAFNQLITMALIATCCIIPTTTARAFNWGIALGTVAGTAIQQQKFEEEIDYMDNAGRDKYFQQLKDKLGVDTNPAYNRMLNRIMKRLSSSVAIYDPTIRQKPYNYFINPEPDFNAFCTLGHNISVNAGLFKALNSNEDEIALVLAHEMTHGEQNHVRKSIKKSFPIRLITNIYASQNPNTFSTLGSNIMANNMIAKGITRKQEIEADNNAFIYATAAGYNIGAGAATWQRFIDIYPTHSTNFVGELFSPSDHPSAEWRRDNYAAKLTAYSNGVITVDPANGMIKSHQQNLFIPAASAAMSSAERAYLVAGNLAKVYHGHPKQTPPAILKGNTVYMGVQPIMVILPGDNSKTILQQLNHQ